eukprot:9491611-Pyramimonas_sp.AAC.1
MAQICFARRAQSYFADLRKRCAFPQGWEGVFRYENTSKIPRIDLCDSRDRLVVCAVIGVYITQMRQTDLRVMLAGPKGRAVGKSGELDTGCEKGGRVSGVLSAPLPLLAQEDP